jgi:hypothetical protein
MAVDASTGGAAMTTDDLRAGASRILERMIREHPDEASVLASLVLSEILSVGLFDDDEAGVTAFADAVNGKLGEIALGLGASRSWQLVRAEPPRRH